MISLGLFVPADALVDGKVVLVVTKVDLVAQRIGLSEDEVTAQLSKIGDVVDVPDHIADQQDVRDLIKQEADKRNVSAIQIIGDYNIIRSNLIWNPAQDGDDDIDTDDLYADFDGDNKADVPIVRLPLGTNADIWNAQFKRIKGGYEKGLSHELNNPAGGRNDLWAKVVNAMGAGVQMQNSEPVGLPGNPADLPSDSYMTAILLHGDDTDCTQWWGEYVTSRGKAGLPVGMNQAFADFDGMVYSAACYGAYINGKTQAESLALTILLNGAQCFIGSTRMSYSADGLNGNTVIPIKMSEELSKDADPLAAYYAGKMRYYEDTSGNVVNGKMRLQYQYYGLVPSKYWKESVATSLVFDLSTSMDEGSAYGNNSKISAAKEQGRVFVASMESQAEHSASTLDVGVVSFSGSSGVDIELSSDYGAVTSAIAGLDTIGGTNIYAGLNEGIRQLESVAGQKIMVFLSDGMDTAGNSDSSILDLAQQAADKGIRIYTIGFGASGDLNESLLEQIASITGGAYAHEDPSSVTSAAVGIFAMMTKAQLSATSQVLADHMGTVAQGETVDAGDFVVEGHGDIQTTIYWPGSTLDLKLTDPLGAAVQEGYPGYSVQTEGTLTQVHVEGAKEGQWNMSVYGADVSMPEEPYYVITAFNETEGETEAPQTVVAGGGAQDDGSGLLLFVVVAAIAALGGVFAYSVRNKESGEKGDGHRDGMTGL
jgi:hypothetical protein